MRMNDDKALATNHSHRLESCLAVLFAVINVGDNDAFENQGRIKNINVTGFDYFFPFCLVPFEFQFYLSIYDFDVISSCSLLLKPECSVFIVVRRFALRH